MRLRELRVTYHPTRNAPRDERPRLDHPASVCALVTPLLEHEPVEVSMVLLLDTRNRLIAYQTIGRGTLDSCSLDSRDVLRAALLSNAAGVITVHNHPSGDPTPSAPDLHVFSRLNAAAKIVGIPVLDHAIIGHDGRSYSHQAAGRMP